MYTMPTFSHANPRKKQCSLSQLVILITEILCLIALAGANPKSIASVCKNAPYKQACESILLSSLKSNAPKTPKEVFDQSVQFTLNHAQWAQALAYNLSHLSYHKVQTNSLLGGMTDCFELLDDSIDQLSNVVINKKINNPDDVRTWLSAALTNQETCIQSLENYKFHLEKGVMDSLARNLSHFISNSLALFMSTKPNEAKSSDANDGVGRRLLSENFPAWVSLAERKLLEASLEEIKANFVVAKDGSGTHKTLGEAVGLVASLAGGGRSVIYIKAGVYHETIKIPTKQKNVMLVGDGKGKTVIVDDKNSNDGSTTYQSATVGAMGDGFIARDITFVNSAGPAKHQAVALRVGADKSVVFRCSILGYQDTLYTHSKRQFYRETDIYGTIDFIFGNSAVVFQSCNIYVRKPLSSGQNNFITAQGRSSPYQNTGISIHNCKIGAASDLSPVKSKIATYLGRPWKQYSRTVVMQSFLDDSIHRSGWSPWSGGFALKTLYYGEYMNSGPGSSTSGRVSWPGYHASLTSSEAESFTVGGFIAGNVWLPSTGVSFDSGLLG